jgi:hypothetical protein
VTGIRLPDKRVTACLVVACHRLGIAIPPARPKVFVVPGLKGLRDSSGYPLTTHDGAYWPDAQMIAVVTNDEALIQYELGRWLCHQAGYDSHGRRSAAWARRASGSPLWMLGWIFG